MTDFCGSTDFLFLLKCFSKKDKARVREARRRSGGSLRFFKLAGGGIAISGGGIAL